jgi:hypothetical protein
MNFLRYWRYNIRKSISKMEIRDRTDGWRPDGGDGGGHERNALLQDGHHRNICEGLLQLMSGNVRRSRGIAN